MIAVLSHHEETGEMCKTVPKVSEPGFALAWDNDEDAAYDRM